MESKKLLTLFALAFLLVLPMLSAQQETLGTFKQNECINLLQTCTSCSYNYITSVSYPDSSQALGFVNMTRDGTTYNYTFCNTDKLGNYIVNGYGDLNGIDTNWNYNFIITPSGIIQNSILENPILLILLAISIIFLLIAISSRNYPMAFISGILFLVAGIYTMIYGFNNYTDDFTRAAALVIIGIGAIIVLSSGFEWIQDARSGANNEDEEF